MVCKSFRVFTKSHRKVIKFDHYLDENCNGVILLFQITNSFAKHA